MEQKTDLRIIKTQKALCDAFLIMLREKKFEDITVHELCERAMIRRATFYKHFADKYEFFAFFIRTIQDHFQIHSDIPKKEDTVYSYYFYLFQKCILFLEQNKALIDSILQSNMSATLIDIFSDQVYRNVLLTLKNDEKNGLQIPISAEILSAFYTGGITHLIRFWLTNEKNFSKNDLIDEVEIILRTFASNFLPTSSDARDPLS